MLTVTRAMVGGRAGMGITVWWSRVGWRETPLMCVEIDGTVVLDPALEWRGLDPASTPEWAGRESMRVMWHTKLARMLILPGVPVTDILGLTRLGLSETPRMRPAEPRPPRAVEWLWEARAPRGSFAVHQGRLRLVRDALGKKASWEPHLRLHGSARALLYDRKGHLRAVL